MMVFPDPFRKRVFDGLLFLLRERGFLLVQYAALLAGIGVFVRVVNAHVPQIQRVLQNMIGVNARGSVGSAGGNVPFGDMALMGNAPLRRKSGIVDADVPARVPRRFEQFVHELLNVALVHPRRAQTHVDFGGVEVFRLRLPERLNVSGKVYFRVRNGGLLRFL